MAERFMSFAIVFLFILVVRQFDKKKSLLFKLVFLLVMIIVISNIASEFFISSSADKNWKYVTNLYDPSGKYQCYVGEVPHGWAIFVPCLKPIPYNATPISSSSASSGPQITFTPPVVPTTTSITSSSSSNIASSVVTFTATISPTPDYGAVQFYVDDTPVGRPVTIFGGQSTFSIFSMSVGLHHISASFSGAPNFYASTSNQTSITILPNSNLKSANLSGASTSGCNGCP
jgi:hypothetical protein